MMRISRSVLALMASALLVAIASINCKNATTTDSKINNDSSLLLQHAKTANKWKLDAPTRKNFAEIEAIINDRSLQGNDYKTMVIPLQDKVNTLVSQCTMEGPAHEALHVWLEQFLSDLKTLKSGGGDPQATYNKLRQDVVNFKMQFS